jgi:hypothetical protein
MSPNIDPRRRRGRETGYQRARQEDGGNQVGRDEPLERRSLEIGDGTDLDQPGIVDQQIETTESVLDGRSQPLDIELRGDVGGENRGASGAFELPRGCAQA